MSDRSASSHPASPSPAFTNLAALALANAFVLGALAFAATLESRDPSFYYRSLQEDGYVEWISFWAFLLASAANLWAAARQRRLTAKAPWFLLGLASFCFFVAMEEISWGQRLLGFQPPAYFLEHNFQQEANLHNVVDKGLRKLALSGVIAGYGVLLPLLALAPPLGRGLARLAVVGPPPGLIPSFAAAWFTYFVYPWKFTGEIVELMLGLGFLFAAVVRAAELRPSAPSSSAEAGQPAAPSSSAEAGQPAAPSSSAEAGQPAAPSSSALAGVALTALLTLALGLAGDVASRSRRSADPGALAAAGVELEALGSDFAPQGPSQVLRGASCGVHRRLYTLVQRGDAAFLGSGAFAELVARGLPEVRAEFLIDPWSTAYWVRFECSESEESFFIYSFGPNRLRDSSQWELRGDDVGVYLLGPPGAPPE